MGLCPSPSAEIIPEDLIFILPAITANHLHFTKPPANTEKVLFTLNCKVGLSKSVELAVRVAWSKMDSVFISKDLCGRPEEWPWNSNIRFCYKTAVIYKIKATTLIHDYHAFSIRLVKFQIQNVEPQTCNLVET